MLSVVLMLACTGGVTACSYAVYALYAVRYALYAKRSLDMKTPKPPRRRQAQSATTALASGQTGESSRRPAAGTRRLTALPALYQGSSRWPASLRPSRRSITPSTPPSDPPLISRATGPDCGLISTAASTNPTRDRAPVTMISTWQSSESIVRALTWAHHDTFANPKLPHVLQATALGIALMVICAIELLGLFYSFQNGVVKWESLWVIFVEVREAALSPPALPPRLSPPPRCVSWTALPRSSATPPRGSWCRTASS